MAPIGLVAEFLSANAGREFRWGEWDCGLWMADWYSFASGEPDPAADLRRTYTSEAECAARFGGAAALRQARALCAALGLERTREYEPGDIGIAVPPRPNRMAIGALRGTGGWIVTGQRGFTKLPDGSIRVAAAWRVPCR